MSFGLTISIVDYAASEPSSAIFSVNRFQSTVRFSQSELLPISSDGTVASEQGRRKHKNFIYIEVFVAQSIHSLLSDFNGIVCARVDAFHISNSIRYF